MKRLRLVALLFYAWFFLIAVRLIYWQVVSHTELTLAATNQHLMQLEIPASRGEILTSDGSPLVSNQIAYLIYAEPKKIKDKPLVAKELSQLLAIDQASLSATLDDRKVWVPIKHKVDKDIAEQIKTLHLDGVGFEEESKRYYPEGSMSAQLIGFVGSTYDGSPQGYFGLEGYYDRELRGRSGYLQQVKDASGKPILAGQQQRVPSENGSTLELHIDRSVQFLIEKKLQEGMEKYGARGGTIIVADPMTGGIIATASEPSYDPREYWNFSQDVYKNPAVADSYEPGSTFKVLTMASAVNEGVVEPTTVFEEKGPIKVGGYYIRTWDDKYRGTITATEILEKSSNVGMVQVGNKLGKDMFLSYLKNFDIGRETGIDLDEESSPTIRDDADWKDIDLATASFGQGIVVTPMQMIKAVSAIANGGKLYTPQVVSVVTTANNQRIEIKPKMIRQVLTPKAANTVKDMMVDSVDHAEAHFVKPKGYRIAGKTGTAQIAVEGHYDKDKTIASFIGFAPADSPKFIMLVTLREPSSSQWGSETAAPLFFSIANELFAYYGIPPSK